MSINDKHKTVITWSVIAIMALTSILNSIFSNMGKDLYEKIKLPTENRSMIIDLNEKMTNFNQQLNRIDSVNKAQWRVISTKKDK